MAKEKGEVAVWLHDRDARLIVGAELVAPRFSRWVAQGVIVDDGSGVGIWLKADSVLELRPLDTGDVKPVKWTFNAGQLLIKWSSIVTIQTFEGGSKEIGFKSSTTTEW